jgi:hypothetical protein
MVLADTAADATQGALQKIKDNTELLACIFLMFLNSP